MTNKLACNYLKAIRDWIISVRSRHQSISDRHVCLDGLTYVISMSHGGRYDEVLLVACPDLNLTKVHSSSKLLCFEIYQLRLRTGTIDQIGDDIRGMKDIGVDHIIFDYMFAPIGSNVADMIDMSKKLSKFAR